MANCTECGTGGTVSSAEQRSELVDGVETTEGTGVAPKGVDESASLDGVDIGTGPLESSRKGVGARGMGGTLCTFGGRALLLDGTAIWNVPDSGGCDTLRAMVEPDARLEEMVGGLCGMIEGGGMEIDSSSLSEVAFRES